MINISDYQLRGGYRPDWDAFELYLASKTEDGTHYVMQLQDEPRAFDRGVIVQPTMTLMPQHAQQLCDILHREGFKPRDGTGGPAQVEALRAHLEDMRRAYDALLEQMKIFTNA